MSLDVWRPCLPDLNGKKVLSPPQQQLSIVFGGQVPKILSLTPHSLESTSLTWLPLLKNESLCH